MDKTLYLEAAHEGGKLQIGIRERLHSDLDPCVDPYEVKELSMETFAHIENQCLKTMDFLGASAGKSDINHRADESLKKMGEMLSDELLTPKIKETIRHSDASYFMIRIDDQMVQIPWELICLDGVFLCERFNLGRLVRTRQEIVETRNKQTSFPINLWILANPGRNLSSADKEGELILRIADSVNPDDMTIVNGSLDSSNATPEQIRFKIKNSDLVHFAGHAEYDPLNISKSGWKLQEGYFSPREIDQMTGSSKMPSIVFSNACRSARTGEWKADRNSFGIVNAFLRAGVKYYLGTAWEIMDTPSTLFACEFYSQLFAGESIGEAVRLARKEIKEHYSNDYVGWAGYVLYGDPRYRLFDTERETPAVSKKQPVPFYLADERVAHIRGAQSDAASPPLFPSKKKKAVSVFSFILLIALACGFLAWGVAIFQKKIDLDVIKINREFSYKEKERNDLLINTIRKNNPPPDASDSGTPTKGETATIALVYDAENAKSGIVASVMKKELLGRFGKIRFVERQELNTLLEEVNLAFSLPSRKKLALDILPADYILKLNAIESLTKTEIVCHLLSTESGENLLLERFDLIGRKAVPEGVIDRMVLSVRKKKE